MNIILSAPEMQQADAVTIRDHKVPSLVLMERAAVSVCDYIQDNYSNAGLIGICCGTGNNGGDGLAIARILFTRGFHVLIHMVTRDTQRLSTDCAAQLAMVDSYSIPFVNDIRELRSADVLVDALFGTGLSREITGAYASIINEVNDHFSMPIIAVDIASGIDATSGHVLGCAMRADVTITFAFIKLGHLLYPGRSFTGNLSVAEIGISTHSLSKEEPPHTFALTAGDVAGLLPYRVPHGNKGTFGKVLCISGSKNMAGAAVLSAQAALTCGCGMVKVFTEEANRTILQTALSEALLSTYDDDFAEEDLLSDMDWADVVLIGPGLSTSDTARRLVKCVLEHADKPVVMDADALNILSTNIELLRRPHGQLAVTPHVAEMGRLRSMPVSDVKAKPVPVANAFAKEFHVTCVLKDAATVTSTTDGNTYVNMTGNSGLATAGSGDVLCGMIAGLCAQGMPLDRAAPLAVYLHGAAADAMSRKKSAYSLTARDVIAGIPGILIKYEK